MRRPATFPPAARAATLLPVLGISVWTIVGACGGDAVTPPVGVESPVTSIALSPTERTIGVLGASFQIRALALATDGEALYGSFLDPQRFSWSSSAPDIATVTDEVHPVTGRQVRLVTGVAVGTATITATSDGLTDSITVTVRDRARPGWAVPIPGGIGIGNVMGPDGTVYVGTLDFATDRALWYAVSPGEGVRWTLELPITWNSIPAIGEDGTLYVGSRTGSGDEGFTGQFMAVDPAGSVRWMLEDLDGIRSSPAIGPDGTIYVAAGHHVYAVEPDGEIRWTFDAEDDVFVFGSPGIAADGTIYIGAEDARLYAIAPDGSLRWAFKTGERIRSSPAIGADGTIYVGSHDGRLYAIAPDGTERWNVPLVCGLPWGCQDVRSSPSVGPDGTIYVMVDGVFAMDPSGSIRWHYPGTNSGATPVLGADGTIYVANSAVLALDAGGTLLWDYRPEQAAGGSPIIGLDGTIIAAAGEELVGIVENAPANGGFAGAPWPQARGDRANTGRAGG